MMMRQFCSIPLALLLGVSPLNAQETDSSVDQGTAISVDPLAQPASTNIIYVAPTRMDEKPEKGTQKNPFDGGSPEKFDAVLAEAPADSLVILFPGEYLVRSNMPKKYRCRGIMGSGMYATILKLAIQPQSDYYTPFYSGGGNYDSFVVSDLTFDLQASQQPRGCVLNCSLTTRRGGFERVRVIGWGNSPLSIGDGTPANPNVTREAFGLVVGPTDGSQPSDVFVRDCVVEPATPDVPGGGNTCLGFNTYLTGPADSIPASGKITGNFVDARPGDCGIALAGLCQGVIVSGNHVRNAGRGFHQDTSMTDIKGVRHATRDTLVTGNQFEDCWPLVGLGSAGNTLIDGVRFNDNQCTIASSGYAQYGGGAVFFLDKNVTNFSAINNRILTDPAKPFNAADKPLLFILNGDNGVVKVENNVVDERFGSPPLLQAADTPDTSRPTTIRASNNFLPSGKAFPPPFAGSTGNEEDDSEPSPPPAPAGN